MELTSLPGDVTPWLQFFLAVVGSLAAAGGGVIWLRRWAGGAFVEAVNDAVGPLQDTVDRIETDLVEDRARSLRVARERKREVDSQFIEVKSKIGMLEARIVKSQEAGDGA